MDPESSVREIKTGKDPWTLAGRRTVWRVQEPVAASTRLELAPPAVTVSSAGPEPLTRARKLTTPFVVTEAPPQSSVASKLLARTCPRAESPEATVLQPLPLHPTGSSETLTFSKSLYNPKASQQETRIAVIKKQLRKIWEGKACRMCNPRFGENKSILSTLLLCFGLSCTGKTN